jgi:uncharacterized membrane protein YraQ (UPF0718 family)
LATASDTTVATVDELKKPRPVWGVFGSRAAAAIWINLLILIAYRATFRNVMFAVPSLQYWSTIFLAIVLQALPFLALGVVLSAGIAVLVPSEWIARALPKRTSLAVPTAALAGMALPGCECSSVPVARRMISRGVPSAAALTFLLAAPAVNPVVLVATAVAFPYQPEMVWARLLASMLAAIVVGWTWSTAHADRFMRKVEAHRMSGSRAHAFATVAVEDLVQAGGYLVLGAAIVATLQTYLPADLLSSLGGSGIAAVLLMGVMAVGLAVCSEADAFVAAALNQFSPTARLAFMVVGPMVDIKLVSMQVGAFGRSFAVRFAPLTFAVCILASLLVGWWLL